MSTMVHDGFLAEIEIDEGAGLLKGVVVNCLHRALKFNASDVPGLRRAFAEVVDGYRAEMGPEAAPPRPWVSEEAAARHLESAFLRLRKRPDGAPDYQPLPQAYDEFRARLGLALAAFREEGDDGRKGISMACDAVLILLARRWENPELSAPFGAVLMALVDVENGRKPDVFTKRTEPLQRPRSESYRLARDFTAALLEAAIKQGGELDANASRIARMASRWSVFKNARLNGRTITGWRTEVLGRLPADRRAFEDMANHILAQANPAAFVDELLKSGPPSAARPGAASERPAMGRKSS